jgi:outer membrane protein assembly factor BamB
MKAKVFILLLTSLIFVIYEVHGIAEEYEWSQWRGPNGDGISLETDWNPQALNGGPKILWKADVGVGYSNVAIKDNRLYTMGVGENRKENVISCFNTGDGKVIWQYTFETTQSMVWPKSTPAIDGKNIYALSNDGILLCLKVKNGKLRWQKNIVEEFKTEELHYGYAQSPVIEGNHILLNINTSGIAVNKKSGELIWASDGHDITFNEGYYSTPVIYNYEEKRYVLLFSGTGLFSVDVQTGNPLWFYEWFHQAGTDVTSTAQINSADPVVFENRIFISSCYGLTRCALLEIIENEPTVLWQNENMKNYFSSSVYVDGYLYGIDEKESKRNTLRCVDWETGHLMWEQKINMASLIAADGKLLVLEENGFLYITEATPKAYQEISNCDVLGGEEKGRQFWTPPVLYKGKIYCRNLSGDLVCIDVSK